MGAGRITAPVFTHGDEPMFWTLCWFFLLACVLVSIGLYLYVDRVADNLLVFFNSVLAAQGKQPLPDDYFLRSVLSSYGDRGVLAFVWKNSQLPPNPFIEQAEYRLLRPMLLVLHILGVLRIWLLLGGLTAVFAYQLYHEIIR